MYLHPITSLLLLLLIDGWSCQLAHGGHNILALFVNGHRSHLLLYTSVINLLLDRGQRVTVITTHDISGMLVAADNLRWIKLSENYTTTVVSHEGLTEIEVLLRRIEKTATFMDDPQWQKFISEDNQFDLMILGYLFNDYQLGVSAHFGCPVVVLWTGQPIGYIHSLMGNPEERWYVPQPYDRHQYRGLKAVAFGWFEKSVEYLSLYKMKQVYDQHFPAPQYPSFWQIRKTVSLALCNHHSLSEGPIAPFVPGIIEIGGLAYQRKDQNRQDKPMMVEHILHHHQKVIYFSFGSRVKWSQLDPTIEMKFVEAFRAFPNYTILWTYDKDCNQLQSYASNILCKSWWPQPLILASNSTQLFISHGGKGSLAEAFRYGKPIMGLPLFGDQRANIANMESRKLGLKLNIYDFTSKDLIKTLSDILMDGEYTQNAMRFSRVYRDRPMTSEESVIYWLEYVIRYKGARHLRSPAVDLNFIEYHNLDIYTIIVIVITIFVWGCNYLENKLRK